MKKVLSFTLVALILCISAVSLFGCTKLNEEDLPGMYSGYYTADDGNQYVVVLMLNDDDTYTKTSTDYKDPKVSVTENGTFDVSCNDINLYKDGNKEEVQTFSYKQVKTDGKTENQLVFANLALKRD